MLTADALADAVLADFGIGGGKPHNPARGREGHTPNPISLTDYKHTIYRRYLHGKHLEALDQLLTQVTRYVETGGAEGIGRAIIEMPPRHGKTVTTSRLYPTWHLGNHPDHRIMLVSYGATLAEKNSRFARNLVQSPKYRELFPHIHLAQDSKAVDAWDLDGFDGGMDALGIGGGATGKGAHLLIIDDPIKNREEAESEVIREKVWNGYTDDLYTRLEPGGAVVVMMCMTGDTPVLMADGTEHLLREIKVGDRVATYDNGVLGTSVVQNHKSNGRDLVYKIMTTSGRIVHANERHPFLVEEHGELKWIRLKNLTTAHKIVTVKDSGVNGRARPALSKVAKDPLVVVDTVPLTTIRKNGLMDIVLRPLMRKHTEIGVSNTDMVSLALSMMRSMLRKAASVLFAVNPLAIMFAHIGVGNCVSTTTMRPIQSGDCCATTVTLPLDIQKQWIPHSLLQNTSDFTTEAIVSIEPDGIKEVFDVQIERTENFIANGLVSHNTRWHMDDLIGRLLNDNAEKWVRLHLPAIAHEQDPLGRSEGEALWDDRFPLATLRDIESTVGVYSWSALYDQNPVPASGGLFKRSYFDSSEHPLIDTRNLPNIAYAVRYWDLAMSEKTSADYTVGLKYGMGEDGHRYILDVSRERVDWGELPERMAQVMLQDGANVAQGIEEKGYQSRAIQKLNADPRLHGYGIFGYEVDKDKFTRALPAAAKAATGLVHLVKAHWNEPFIEEVCAFPLAAHDDQVDAFSGAEEMLMDDSILMIGQVIHDQRQISQSAY